MDWSHYQWCFDADNGALDGAPVIEYYGVIIM